jgi:hypothetical protein
MAGIVLYSISRRLRVLALDGTFRRVTAHRNPVGTESLASFDPDRLTAGRVSDNLASSWLRSARDRGAGRIPSDPDPDTATAQTVAEMCDQVRSSARDPEVMRAAFDAARRFRGGPLFRGEVNSPAALAQSAWWWAKQCIRFEHHEATIRRLLNERNQLQLLISPDVLVRMADRRGDCAIFTELICAFLSVLGVPWEIVTASVDPREPGVFSHVYPRAVMPDGSRIALDASHGRFPGWRVPSAHTFRDQVWDMDGRPVEDRGSRFDGLHGYVGRGLGDDKTTLSDPGGWFSIDQGGGTPAPAAAPAPAGGGFDWGSLLGGLANQWTQIGGRILAPTTSIQRGPNGQLFISTPNSPTAATAAAAGSAVIGGGGIPSTFVWAGIAVLAVVVVTSMSKGR